MVRLLGNPRSQVTLEMAVAVVAADRWWPRSGVMEQQAVARRQTEHSQSVMPEMMVAREWGLETETVTETETEQLQQVWAPRR